jgi:hypothetical protein
MKTTDAGYNFCRANTSLQLQKLSMHVVRFNLPCQCVTWEIKITLQPQKSAPMAEQAAETIFKLIWTSVQYLAINIGLKENYLFLI